MINWTERAKAAFAHVGQGGTAETDETTISRLLAVLAVPTVAVSVKPERLSSVLTVIPPSVLEKHDSSITLAEDADRWCWPNSSAMNSAEIDTFALRLARFTDKGLSLEDAEALADKLMARDRDLDDRRICMECRHLSDFGHGSWRCGNWKAARVAIHSRDAYLAADLVVQLERCDGFTEYPTSTPQGIDDEHDRH